MALGSTQSRWCHWNFSVT